jgi:hypothetical protein
LKNVKTENIIFQGRNKKKAGATNENVKLDSLGKEEKRINWYMTTFVMPSTVHVIYVMLHNKERCGAMILCMYQII